MEESAPVSVVSTAVQFSSLGLSEPLLRAVESLGYTEPTPVQALTIPAALLGGDIVGLSQTGSGKTAAFMLPALERLDPALRKVQVLALSPTRELAVQVARETEKLAKFLPRIRTVAVYGGASIMAQMDSLAAGAHIVVGTPGRLLDHLRRGTLDLSNVKIAVLDEADEMLDMGFRDEIEQVMQALPESRQTLFFSATMEPRIEKLIQTYGKEPRRLSIDQKTRTVEAIEQSFFDIHWRSRMEVLCRLLDIHDLRRGIIFANRKADVDDLTEALLEKGYSADRLHGDMTQMLRDRVMARFRNGALHLLVATDVAARGIDIKDIDVVFNFELPDDPEDYVHRIGRTGRAGRSGMAFSFVCGKKDSMRLRNAERYARVRIARVSPPTPQEVEEKRLADHVAHLDTVMDQVAAGELPPPDISWIQALLDKGRDLQQVAGVLFSMLRQSNGHECEPIPEDERRLPAPAKKRAVGTDGPAVIREAPVKRAAPAGADAPAPAFSPKAAAPKKTFNESPASDEPELRPARKRAVRSEEGAGDARPARHERPERASRDAVDDRDAPQDRPARPARGERPAWAERQERAVRTDRFVKSEQPARAPKEFEAPRGPARNESAAAGTFILINVGTRDGARPREIAGMIYRSAGLGPGNVGAIEIRDGQSMAQVPADQVAEIARRVSKTTWRGRRVVARPVEGD